MRDMEALFTHTLNIAVGCDFGITVTILFFSSLDGTQNGTLK